MKNIKSLLIFTLCLAVIAGTMAVFPAKAYATGYKYKVTINAGKEGTLDGDNGSKTVKTWQENIDFGGQAATITQEGLGLTLPEDSPYYIRGLKISGHDNDETDTRHYTFPVTIRNITEDMSLSVAYGVKGEMIDYVVRYVDANNTSNDLVPAHTYYGMPGDYLVVSAEYMDGYQPDAYNKGWTLREDGIREIIFYMSRITQGGGNAGDNGDNGGNGGGTNNAGTTAGNTGANTGQPAQFVNLDDNQTPTTDPGSAGGNNGGNNGDGTSNIDDQNPPTTVFERVGLLPFILGGGLLAALIALIAFLRARGRDGDEEDADELEDIYINDPEGINKLQNADPEQFKTDDPDKLKEAFKELGDKE